MSEKHAPVCRFDRWRYEYGISDASLPSIRQNLVASVSDGAMRRCLDHPVVQARGLCAGGGWQFSPEAALWSVTKCSLREIQRLQPYDIAETRVRLGGLRSTEHPGGQALESAISHRGWAQPVVPKAHSRALRQAKDAILWPES